MFSLNLTCTKLARRVALLIHAMHLHINGAPFRASEHMHEAALGCIEKKQEEGEGNQVEERKTTSDGETRKTP